MTTTINARVTCVQKNLFTITTDDGKSYDAKLKGKFYNLQLEPPVTGDFVEAQINEYGDALIDSVLPRRTAFKRPNRSGHADAFVKNLLEETVCANFDYVFIVTSLNQNFNENRIARYASLTLQTGAKPVIVLSKADLCEDPELQVQIAEAICSKADVVAISSKTGYGIEKLKSYLEPGKTIAFLGSSGVGKSTLLNTLSGQDLMKVSDIRAEDGKGRHTTTYRQLFRLDCGTWIMDTPGLRELGIMDADDGIDETFEDVTSLFCECRFNDCSHTKEPGCAVRAAIEEGRLDPERWEMYNKLHTESQWSREKMKQVAKYNRMIQNKVEIY